MNTLAVAVFHGIGTFDANFAEPLIREVRARLAVRSAGFEDFPRTVYRPIAWGDVFEHKQAELCHRMSRGFDLGWSNLRDAVIAGLGDAIAFHPTPGDRADHDAVCGRVAEELGHLADEAGPEAPLCVIAHSFGSVVANGYFASCEQGRASASWHSPLVRGQTLATFVTLGSPLALWGLRFADFGQPLNVPSPELRRRHPRLEGVWLNLYDPNDVLGFPLGGLNAAYAEAVLDLPVTTNGVLSSWSPWSHFGYWTNDSVASAIVAALSVLGRQLAETQAANGQPVA